jgi:hypothetical protein
MLQILTILISVFLLNACSTLSSSPSVLVLPGIGKNFDQFRNDDLSCRQLVRADIAATQNEIDSKEEGQQSFDIGYIQCMYSKGHQVPVPEEFMHDARQEGHPVANMLKP